MKKRNQAISVLATVMLLGSVYPVSIYAAAASPTTNQGQSAVTSAQASHSFDPQQLYMDLAPEEAGKLAGFAVKLPGYIPEGNYYLAGLTYSAENKSVSVSYFGKGGYPILAKMWKGDIGKEAAGLKETVFPKGKAYVGKKPEEYGEMNIFMWEEAKGVIYMLASGLDVEELDKMAQSMGTGDYSTIRRAIPIKDFESKNHLTVLQASEMSGIPVKLPSYPQNGKAANISYTKSYGDEYVLVMYDIPDRDNALLNIEIKKADLKEEADQVPLIDYPNKNAKAIPFENGVAYTYQLSGSSVIHPELTHFNGLMWQEEKGVVYKLISDLPYEELMKIASSIK
ncbi:DUF4367 domain-containing protein [Brevibacillus sp. GCM10020057]|uniref:DUF4367 domain-containing protein n=1 Tax=Brevibacillus sp. GCM10020057 TaxID=3317327 RepID=UPI0036340AA0